jgi:LacI family transcriptional regulator
MGEQAFVPNIVASNLAGGRSRFIGVLIPSLTWPLIPEILRGVSEMIGRSSHELLLYSSTHEQEQGSAELSEVIDHILATRIASGLLAVYPGAITRHLTEFHEQGLPMVIIDDREQPTTVPWVSADNRGGALEATRYLLRLGHRRIAYIQGLPEYRVSRERYQGYCDALSEAGLEPERGLVLQADFVASSGRSCAEQFFAMAEPPTAIFAANDQMAYDVLASAEEHGLRVPEQFSLIGFDDIPPSAYTHPALTTVRQPFYDLGKRATEVLLSLLDEPRPVAYNSYAAVSRSPLVASSSERPEPVRIQLTTHLVVRASCCPPRSATAQETP